VIALGWRIWSELSGFRGRYCLDALLLSPRQITGLKWDAGSKCTKCLGDATY